MFRFCLVFFLLRSFIITFLNTYKRMATADVQPGTLKSIQFGLLSPEELLEISRVCVDSQDVIENGNQPKSGGLLDLRMGTMDRSAKCQTCLSDNRECMGHFGHIELAKPVYNYGHMQYIIDILRCVCPHCSRLLLSRKHRAWKKLEKMPGRSRIKEIVKIAVKAKKCYFPGKVKNDPEGCGKLIAEYRYVENIRIIAEFPIAYPEFHKDAKFVMSSEQVLRIFTKIRSTDYPILNFDGINSKPQWMIFTRFPVPPNCLKPSNKSNAAARQEDDITKKLADVINVNKVLKNAIEDGLSQEKISELSQVLQIHIALYLDSKSVSPKQKFIVNKKLKGMAQKLSHKDGRFRGNLNGKRNDFTARGVISPDPFIGINEVGIPRSVAITLTKKVPVNGLNVVSLTEMVKNGPFEVYGANMVTLLDGRTVDLKEIEDTESILPLKEGMFVERHVIDGDLGTFNRQPSLHRMSYQAHRTRILPYSTFRLNLSVTTPYNAGNYECLSHCLFRFSYLITV
jgi:DNA-directed RNA polymerase II subunit RPB1